MAISVADNFSYQGTKPLDARIKFDTVANMKTFAESKLYDGCLAYVTGTKKYYSFDSTNTVDPDTGKWREYSTGDSYVLPIASDEVLGGIKVGDNLEIGDDGTLNAILPTVDLSNEITGYNVYSTTEKLIGQWTDGKPLYQKVFTVSGLIALASNRWTNTSINGNYIDRIIECFIYFNKDSAGGDTIVFFPAYATIDFDTINLLQTRNVEMSGYGGFVLQYTKASDSAQPIGSPNDYSTTEKIVGTWTDGKPLYQKVVPITLNYAGSKQYSHGITNVDFIFIKWAISNSGVPLSVTEIESSDTAINRNYSVVIQMLTSSTITILAGSNRQYTAYICFQYTKTTD